MPRGQRVLPPHIGDSLWVTEASYIIYTKTVGGVPYYYAKNGSDGSIVSNANFMTLWDTIKANNTNYYFKEDIFSVATELTIQNLYNISLIGSGRGTRFVAAGDNTIIKIGHRTDSGLGARGIHIVGIYFDGSLQTTSVADPEANEATNYFAIAINTEGLGNTDDIFIEYCYFYNTGSDSIYGWDRSNVNINNCVFKACRGYWAAIHQHGPQNHANNILYSWTVTGCSFKDCIAGIRHSEIITNNVFTGCGSSARSLATITAGMYGGIINDNKIYNAKHIGIKAFGATGIGGIGYTISHNYVNTDPTVLTAIGIDAQTGSSATILRYVTIDSNTIYGTGGIGIHGSRLQYSTITNNIVADSCLAWAYSAIRLRTEGGNPSIHNIVSGNIIYSSGGSLAQYGIQELDVTTDYNNIFDNKVLTYSIGAIQQQGPHTKIYGNEGYIAPGEPRFASGSLTAGVANAICFAWNNPEAQDILIKKVVIEVTTGGGTAGSHLDVGIADDAAGTNRGTEFFDDLLLNTAQIDDSWVAGDGGTQIKWVFCDDSAAVANDWVVGQILDANAASLVGRYYIEYVGR